MQILMFHEAGSSSRYWSSAIQIMAQKGVDVRYGTLLGRGPGHEEAEAAGCQTFVLDCSTSRDYPRAAIKLASIIRATRPDIVHLNEPIQAGIGGVAAAIARHPRRIFHRHHTVVEGRQRHLSSLGSRLTHMTMAISDAVAKAALKEGVPSNKLCVAFNGVPDHDPPASHEVTALRDRLQISDGESVILLVGRLRPEKGHLVLLRAVRELESRGSRPLHVVIVGEAAADSEEPPEIRQVRTESVHLRTPFHFVGHQSRLAPWHEIADVTVVPSLREPFGLVAPEAMAAGLPLVASRVDGLTEIVVDGETGILVPPGDPAALASAISSILEDPHLRRRLAEAGRARYLARFGDKTMVEAWIDCYENLVTGRPVGPLG